MTRREAISYLAPGEGAPWHWEAEGGALVWQDGLTIALREEVTALLESQTARRWPPFEAFVLVLAACRGRTLSEAELVQRSHRTKAGGMLSLLQPGTAATFERARLGLERVAALPESLRRGHGVRRQLAALLGEEQPAADAGEAERQREILRVLGEGAVGLLGPEEDWRDPMPALAALADAFGTVDEAGLTRRLRTGIAAPLQPAEVPLEPARQVRALLQRLASEPERAGLARAARDVLAALQLPRRVATTDELSSSGAADLANRGPLDRLLLSELAHDDDVLAARLALREALYVRREPPAMPPAGSFVVLLDAGIRSWGAPRVFGLAVALALAALDEKRPRFACYRASDDGGGSVVPLQLETATGLEAALEALEMSAHPGPALRAFCSLRAWTPSAGETEPEAVIVLTPEALADPDFQRCLAEVPRLPRTLYFATVARDGDFALTLHPTSGRAPTSAARIDLTELTAEPPRRQPDESDLPVFLRQSPTPLLLPVHAGLRASIRLRDGQRCALTERRELWTWNPLAQPAPQGSLRRAHHLPGGRLLLLREEPDGRVLVVTTSREEGRLPLVLADLASETQERVWVSTRHAPQAVSESNDESMLLFHYADRIEAVDVRTGEIRDSRNLSEGLRRGEGRSSPTWLQRCGPRYYRHEAQLVAAAWDGRLLFVPFDGARADFLAVFARPGRGVWGLAKNGAFGDFSEGKFVPREQWEVRPDLRFGAISAGAEILFLVDPTKPAGGGLFLQVDVQGKRSHRHYGNDPLAAFAQADLPPDRHSRNRLRRLGVTSEHRLALENRSGGWIVLDAKPGAGLVCTIQSRNSLHLRDAREFEPVQRPRTAADALQLVRFPSGARAYLDTRGLLHLCPADTSRPELTVTLGDGQCGVWASDGRWAGPPYFLGAKTPNLSREEVLGRLVDFCQEALQPA
ncbi:MAG: hypothetical protein JSR82_09275 [Verrucomicrobia bacterium]|nr:hypothetical protein [Verrucomicrobiota bacterium]